MLIWSDERIKLTGLLMLSPIRSSSWERLIRLLAGPEVELCVVGDDDQAIYQWRGSNVANIVGVGARYPDVRTFSILDNRRSGAGIVDAASTFAASIPGRIDKAMTPVRPAPSHGTSVAVWSAEHEVDEAAHITNLVLDLHDAGLPYADMAVLVRGRVTYGPILEQFATFDVPVQASGRTGLFDQPEAVVLGRTLCWLVDHEWRAGYQPGEEVVVDDLLDEYQRLFELDGRGRRRLASALDQWKALVPNEARSADLMRDYYELLAVLDVRSWDLSDPLRANRLGTLARFSALLADFESVRSRSRTDPDHPGEQVGAWDRGVWYFRNLAIHVVNYA